MLLPLFRLSEHEVNFEMNNERCLSGKKKVLDLGYFLYVYRSDTTYLFPLHKVPFRGL